MSKIDISTDNRAGQGGVGFAGLLTIAFIVLKLIGQIDWPWVWVLSPLWISAALVVLVVVVGVALAAVANRGKY